jgi:hypothetical protein
LAHKKWRKRKDGDSLILCVRMKSYASRTQRLASPYNSFILLIDRSSVSSL